MLHPYEHICEILAKDFYVDTQSIDRTAFLHDLRLDSLDVVELSMVLEDERGIIIPDHEMELWRTVGCVEQSIRQVEQD